MESRSGGDLIIWLAAFVAISPVLPLAVGLLGFLCGRVPGTDFLCAASDGRHSIQGIGFVYGTFGFLVTVPIGIVLALLGMLVNSLQDTDAPSSAVNSQAHDLGEARDKRSDNTLRQREPTTVVSKLEASAGRAESERTGVSESVAAARPAESGRTNWPLRATGIALVTLGVLCLSPFFYQDAETLRETAVGGFVLACLGSGLLIGGAICLTRSAGTGRA